MNPNSDRWLLAIRSVSSALSRVSHTRHLGGFLHGFQISWFPFDAEAQCARPGVCGDIASGPRRIYCVYGGRRCHDGVDSRYRWMRIGLRSAIRTTPITPGQYPAAGGKLIGMAAEATTAASSGPTLTAFQNTRGATFTTPGTGFLQTPLNVTELTSINPAYTTTFSTFSPVRIFTPVGSNITDVTFSLPGSMGATPATVAGFGAVFS